MTTSSELSLDIEQLIEASPETVFRLLTDPNLYGKWFGPVGSRVAVREMNVVLGGRFEIGISFPDMDFEVGIEGFYEVVEPPIRLVHTWRSLDEELVTTVAFELEPQGTSTRLSVHHRGFVDPVDLEQNEGGWRDLLQSLAAVAIQLEEDRG